MNRNILCPILAVFFSVLSTSQETSLKVKESPQFREQVASDEIVGMLTTSKMERGIVKFSKEHITIDVFGKDLEPLTTSVTEKHKKENHLSTFYFNDEIKFLTVLWPKRKIRELYAYTFNINERKLAKTLLLRDEVENPRKGIFKRSNDYQQKTVSSIKGSYVAVVLDDFKSTANSYTVQVFTGSGFENVFSKSIVENDEKFYNLNDVGVDENANVFLIRKLFKEGKRDKKEGKANYDYILSKVNKDEILEGTIDKHGKFLNSLSFGLPKEELMLVGFFSESASSDLKGTCNYIVDKSSLRVVNSQFDDLPITVYEDLYGEEKAKQKKGKELGGSLFKASDGNFFVDHVFVDDKENMYIVAEEFYVTTNTTQMGMNGGMMVTYTYHYDDILVIKYDDQGKLKWGRSIFKRATAPSYNAFIKDEKLHLILNSGKNLLEKNDGRTKVSKGWFESTSLYDIVIDENGAILYNKIQDNRDNNYYLPASGSFSENSFIMIDKKSKDIPYRHLMLLE